MKIKNVIILSVSVILNVILIREIITYQPDIYKYRHYHKYKMMGWFDKGAPFNEVKSDSVAYILTIGQANAGNTSTWLDTAGAGVFSYYRGKLYPAVDPMIGSHGYGGSVWPAVGDSLIKDNLFKKVIFIPIAVSSTNIQDWATGECSVLLKQTLEELKSKNVKLTHILWHQGESNSGTPKEEYKDNLRKIVSIIRTNGQLAPFYCSIASLAPASEKSSSGIDTNVQQAQIEFINENSGILAGPNTDLLNLAVDRYDGVHFSKSGKAKYMNQWLTCLRHNAELVH
jgi:hypothetical protein